MLDLDHLKLGAPGQAPNAMFLKGLGLQAVCVVPQAAPFRSLPTRPPKQPSMRELVEVLMIVRKIWQKH